MFYTLIERRYCSGLNEQMTLKEITDDLQRINKNLMQLNKQRTTKKLLKPLGVGFLIFKHVDEELLANQLKKQALLTGCNLAMQQELSILKEKIDLIQKSGEQLQKQAEQNLIFLIDNAAADLAFLNSEGARIEKEYPESLKQLQGYRNFVIQYNIEWERKKARQELLVAKNEILQAESAFASKYQGDNYFSKKEFIDWKNKSSYLLPIIRNAEAKGALDVDFSGFARKFINYQTNGNTLLDRRNENFIDLEISRFKNYFDTLEAYPLTEEQERAIAIDEQNNLVVAGAGSGKTSTIVGKAGYLLKKGLARPEKVLLIAFNRNVAVEMDERITEKLGQKLKVKTFHSLGLEIIAECKREKPTVSDLAADDKVKLPEKILEFIQDEVRKDPNFAKAVNEFFLFSFSPYKSMFEFSSYGEYIEYLRRFEVRSLKGDLVKSFEECDIANFLFVNGVEYEYEAVYEVKTANIGHRQYKPDFYLPRYSIYLEHFGIDRDSRTAPYVHQEEYHKSMQWKRELHANNKTTLIETYSYEKQERTLLSNLELKLKAKGVVLKPISNEQVFERLNELGRVNPLAQLLSTFLNLYKSSGKTLAEVQSGIAKNDSRANMFMKIFAKIYQDYARYLSERQEVDFNDMIGTATSLVKQGSYQSSFKYILVDEFQDISQSRLRLLKALLEQNRSKLFAVGDDWQSIYRFTGSDISFMLNFEGTFGFSRTSYLEETFRFNQKLCDFSSKFILQNPKQIRKQVRSRKQGEMPAVSIVRAQDSGTLEQIIGRINSEKKGRETVFIIGRYNFLKPEELEKISQPYPELSIKYKTAHSSKGLQADNVVLIGLTSGRHGFPSQITDDPLLSLVLAVEDDFPNAEERRLFYVAITRAKKHVYLLIDEQARPSEFLTEILNGGYEIEGSQGYFKAERCPICKKGQITQRPGQYGVFYSCSNYPYCDYRPKMCPKCQTGYLQKDKEAYRCSNNDCTFAAHICPECRDGY